MKQEHLKRIKEACEKHNVDELVQTSDGHVFLTKNIGAAKNHAQIHKLTYQTVNAEGDIILKEENSKKVKPAHKPSTKTPEKDLDKSQKEEKTLSEMGKDELIAEIGKREGLNAEDYSNNKERAKACRDWDKKNGGAPKLSEAGSGEAGSGEGESGEGGSGEGGSGDGESEDTEE